MSTPPIVSVPRYAALRPERMPASVLLPLPLAPTMAVRLPRGIVASTPSSTTWSPYA